MTRERFEALAEAHGADISRWPPAERDSAAVWLAREPEAAGRVLARAGDLDVLLDAWRPAPAPRALHEAVIAAAPMPRRHLGRWLWGAGLGAGLAAACAAGLTVGVVMSAPPPQGTAAVSAVLSDYNEALAETVAEDA